LEFFLYKKEARLARYQNKKWIKYIEKTQGCVLPNTPLAKSNWTLLGLRSKPGPLFFLEAGSSPAIQAGLDPPARSVTGPS